MANAIPHFLNAGLQQAAMKQEKEKEEQQKRALLDLMRQVEVQKAQEAVAGTPATSNYRPQVPAGIVPTSPFNVMPQGQDISADWGTPGKAAVPGQYRDPNKREIAERLFNHPLAKNASMSDLTNMLKVVYGIMPDVAEDKPMTQYQQESLELQRQTQQRLKDDAEERRRQAESTPPVTMKTPAGDIMQWDKSGRTWKTLFSAEETAQGMKEVWGLNSKTGKIEKLGDIPKDSEMRTFSTPSDEEEGVQLDKVFSVDTNTGKLTEIGEVPKGSKTYVKPQAAAGDKEPTPTWLQSQKVDAVKSELKNRKGTVKGMLGEEEVKIDTYEKALQYIASKGLSPDLFTEELKVFAKPAPAAKVKPKTAMDFLKIKGLR